MNSEAVEVQERCLGLDRKDWFFVGGIVLLAAVLLGFMLNRFLTVVNHDAAIFCILAQSLLKGHYLLVSEPNPQPYFTFPPFMAVQLAGLMLLFHNTDIQALQPVFKGYISLLFLLSLPLFYAWVRQMISRPAAIALTTLVALNPIVFKYSSDILSDTPYWAFSMGALYAAWRFQQNSRTKGKTDWKTLAVTLVLIACCALTRQIGMALVLSFLVSLAWTRQWKPMLVSAVVLSLAGGFWPGFEHVYRSSHRSDIDSLNQQGVQEVLDKSPLKIEYVKHFLVDRPVDMDQNRFQTTPAILLDNARLRIMSYTNYSLDQLLPELKVKINGKKTNLAHFWLFAGLLWLFLVLGFARLWRAFPYAAFYLGLYMGVLAVYPYISPRFILPTYPLILLCTFWGLLAVRDFLVQRQPALAKVAPVVVPIFLLLALIAQLPDTIRWVNAGYRLKVANQGPSLRVGNRAYYETLLWLRAHTPEDSLIISRKPPVTYFYSGRKSTAYPFTAHADKLFAYVEEKQQRYGREFSHIYIFEDHVFGSSTKYLEPVMENEKYRDRFQLVYTEPTTQSRVWLLK